MTRRLLVPVVALAALASLTVAAPGASAASPHCSSTFSVLHNDRIGALRLPAGEYDITLIRQNRITCARASQLFARFLQDFDGTLPRAWRLNVRRARFVNTRRGFGFSVAPNSSGGGGGGQHPGGNHVRCPTFRVLNDDRIAGVTFPQGTYAMTALGGMPCSQASSTFRGFLQNNQTALPRGWRLDSRTGTFSRTDSTFRFQVNLRG